MDEKTKKLVAEIQEKCHFAKTYVAEYKAIVEHVMLSGSSAGRIYYKYPDYLRVERTTGGKSSITVHVRDRVSRFVEGEQIIYQYDLSGVKMPEQFGTIEGFPG